jgi:hypothetical protein
MAGASYVQTNFLSGEWSQTMQGRQDDPRYRSAMNLCVNGIMLETGAWIRRPAFLFAGRTPSGKPARVMPFNFTSVQPYSLEFSDGLIRMRNGISFVMFNNPPVILSVSTANPAVVRTEAAHGATSGSYMQFGNLGNNLPTLQNRQFRITVIDPFTFSISDDLLGGIDGSLLGAIPSGLTAELLYFISTSYVKGSSNDWANIRIIQAETQALLLNGEAPNIITATTVPNALQFATFNFENVVFVDGPYLDPFNNQAISPSSIGLTPSGVSGLITLTAALLNGAEAPSIFAATDVGRQIRLQSAPPTWQGNTNYAGGALVIFNGQVFLQTKAGGAPSGNERPDITPTSWTLEGGLRAIWIYGAITAVNSSTSVQFQILGPGDNELLYTTPIELWRLGVYSGTTGYPTCGCYHEGRVWLGGAVSNRFDASMSNGISVQNGNQIMMSPTAIDGTVADDNGISYILNASDVNEMLWMQSDQQGILCGTAGGEWLIQATTANLPLSPTNIQGHRYTTVGCANIEPKRTPMTLVFVQKFLRKIMEFFPDVYSGRLTAPNLTETAKHLTVGNIEEIAYQQELSPTVWARRGDGTLLGCTYKRENLMARELPTFAGWHHHALGSGRIFESINVAGNATGTLDTLIGVTNDPTTNVRWVEVLDDMPDENDPITAARFVDGAVVPSSYQTVTIGDVPVSLQLNGLWHLNGKTISVFAGGLDVGDWPVTNGSLTIPFGDGINSGPNGTSNTTGPFNPGGGGYLFTPAFVNSFNGAMPIIVGFTFESDGQILRPSSQQDSGARNGPAFAKKRRSNEYGIQVVNSQGLSVGTSFTVPGEMNPVYFKDATEQTIPINQLYSGIHWDSLSDDYSFDSMLAWKITRPYPATVAAIGAFLHTQDR